MYHFRIEKRNERRQSFSKNIEFALRHDSGKPLRGTLTNVSDSGISFYCFTPLTVGDEIVLNNGDLSVQHDFYVVRWVNKLMPNFFMIGLKGVDHRNGGSS